MKARLLYIGILLFFNCGASDDSIEIPEETSNFAIEVDVNSNVGIDETISITVTGNELLKSVQLIADYVDVGTQFLDNQGTSASFNFSYDTVGTRTFIVRATNADDVVREQSIPITITRGNAIKITSVQIISFHNMNQTWDPEFSDSDPNRLADLKFAFLKPKIRTFEDNFNFGTWYLSSVLENQGNLTWDLSSENLFIDPNLRLGFGLGDIDGIGIAQDLMLGPPFDRKFDLSQYIETRPNTINLSVPEINLDVLLTLEWPN